MEKKLKKEMFTWVYAAVMATVLMAPVSETYKDYGFLAAGIVYLILIIASGYLLIAINEYKKKKAD